MVPNSLMVAVRWRGTEREPPKQMERATEPPTRRDVEIWWDCWWVGKSVLALGSAMSLVAAAVSCGPIWAESPRIS